MYALRLTTFLFMVPIIPSQIFLHWNEANKLYFASNRRVSTQLQNSVYF